MPPLSHMHIEVQGGTGGGGGQATAGSGGPGGTGHGPRLSARQDHNHYANQRNINITNISIFSLLLPAGYMIPQPEVGAVDETLNGRGEGSRNHHESDRTGSAPTSRNENNKRVSGPIVLIRASD
ncbi:hypothetical protein B0H11DRAFT_2246911 [Mycena galericulata]|nr:hypothetical protein B0H11DRAFT_2246911 [Mycena galericulata]